MIVVDASVILELLLNTSCAERAAERLLTPDTILNAPHLLDIEVVQVLRRYCRTKRLDPGRAAEALQDFADLPIYRYPHDVFLDRIWELRHNFTAFDAAYVALAEELNIPLVTCDRRLAAASGHTAKIELLTWSM